MKSEKELFNLAKTYVMLSDEFNKNLNEFELDEIKRELEKISDTLLKKRYDVERFVYYQKLYKDMSIGEYFEFVKKLQ